MSERKAVLNVTVDESVAALVREQAAEEKATISSVVEAALREHLKWFKIHEEGLAAMDEHFRENGYPTPEEIAESEARVDEQIRIAMEYRKRREARAAGRPDSAA
jgi:post-segregation antitoxin (ccd killing protein)